MQRAQRPPRIPPIRETVPLEGVEAEVLVARARSGDRNAYGALVKRFRPRIFALALHLTGSRSDADDITQDAFLRAYAKLHTFEGRSQFFTWLYRIALHRALNARRNAAKRPQVSWEDPRIQAAVGIDAEGSPRKAVELHQTYGQLLCAFDALSDLLRTTIVLTTLQGLSHAEAAVVLETTEGTVAWRVHEARKQLQATMKRLQKDPTPHELKLRGARVGREHDEGGFEAALALLIPILNEDSSH